MKIIKKLLSALLMGAIMLSTICAGTISAGAVKVSYYGVCVSENENANLVYYQIFLPEKQRKIWADPASYTKTCKDGHAYGLRIELVFWDGKNNYFMEALRFNDRIIGWFEENDVSINNATEEGFSVIPCEYGWDYGITFTLHIDSPYAEKLKNSTEILGINVMTYDSNTSGCDFINAEGGKIPPHYAPISFVEYTNEIAGTGKKKNLTASYVKVSDISNKAYTGKEIKPSINVKNDDILLDSSEKLVEGKDYTVTYSYNKDIGSAVVTITGIGNYSGVKNVNFDIVPKKTTLKAKKSGNTKAKLSWTSVEGAEKYQIYCSTDGKSYKKLATVSGDKTSYTASKLNFKKHDYKFKVRSYKTVDGTKYYSSYSKAKTLK